MRTSNLYKNTGKIPIASRLSLHYRKLMFSRFMKYLLPESHHLILDVGVTSDDRFVESNYFEKMYPYKDKIVCVGTEDGSHLEEKYPGIQFIQVYPDMPLPFEDKKFDIVFSNAVIEHVGSKDAQMQFVREIIRVSNSFFITTPNRWFPIEFHTVVPFLHWLPKPMYRKVLSSFGEKFWSKEENLNLLSKREFRQLFPKGTKLLMDSIDMLGYPTNLIAYGKC